MSQKIKPKYNVVDLFAGAGGLSYGFLQTGRFKVAAAFELNPSAQKTYLRNHGENVVMYSDVEDALSMEIKEKLGQIDVVIGGPPCQGFSNANRQKNHAISQNNSLVKKFVQAVLHLNPTAFVMENVSMFQSDTHCFYVDISDQTIIEHYGITTKQTEILLLEEKYYFDGVADIVSDKVKTDAYLWSENDYLVLNIVYKTRQNKEKLKVALAKHKKKLIILAEKLTKNRNVEDHIGYYNNLTGDAINKFFDNRQTDDDTIDLCENIEVTIMLQRMLSKCKEIHDNNIIVTEYIQERGFVAKVKSMAVIDYIKAILEAEENGYIISKDVLSAAMFGAPQKRMRFVIMGVKKEKSESISLPIGTFVEEKYRTVEDAIKDIENIDVVYDVVEADKGININDTPKNISDLGQQLRNAPILRNHISTATTEIALDRFKAIKQGDNFHSLPADLKNTYSNTERTQNTIYLRLKYNEPSGTVINVRKSMWIHPIHHRALSVREAARLQTFPDSFVFCGTKDSQYQQVGNAVPPILANAIAEHLCKYMDKS